MKQVLQYFKNYKWKAILAPLFKMLEAAFELLVPLVMAAIIDNGIAGNDKPYIYKMAFVMVGLGVIGLGFLLCRGCVGIWYFPKKVFPGIRYSLVFDLRIGRLSRVFPYVRFCSPGDLSQLFSVLVASLLAVDGSFYLV